MRGRNHLKSAFGFLRGNVLIIMLTRIILSIPIGMSTPYFSLYVLSQGGKPEIIGLVSALGALASVVTSPISGYVTDRFGRVRIIVVFSALQGIVNLLYAVAWNWHLLALGSLLLGLLVLQIPALSAIVADSLLPEKRGIGFASTTFIPGLVRTVAPLVGGYLINEFGLDPTIRYMFFFVFLAMITVALIRQKFLEETIERKEDVFSRNPVLIVGDAYKNMWKTLKGIKSNLRLFGLTMALLFFFNSLTGPFWVVYATEIRQLDAFDWGMIKSTTSIFTLVLTMPTGVIVDRYGKRRLILCGLVLSILPTYYFVHFTSFVEVLVVFLAIGASNALLGPSCRALMADMVPKEMRGRIMSAFGGGSLGKSTGRVAQGNPGFVLAVFSFAGYLLGGYIYGYDPAFPWYLLTLATILSVPAIIMLKEPEKPEE